MVEMITITLAALLAFGWVVFALRNTIKENDNSKKIDPLDKGD